MQEVDTLVQYVISPIWTYFANLKSEKWNLATIFLFLPILFQNVSDASKNYFDMIWITKKKSDLIIKNPKNIFFWQIYVFFWYIALCAILQFCALLSYCYGDNENRALQCKGKVQFLVTSISARYRTGRTHILP